MQMLGFHILFKHIDKAHWHPWELKLVQRERESSGSYAGYIFSVFSQTVTRRIFISEGWQGTSQTVKIRHYRMSGGHEPRIAGFRPSTPNEARCRESKCGGDCDEDDGVSNHHNENTYFSLNTYVPGTVQNVSRVWTLAILIARVLQAARRWVQFTSCCVWMVPLRVRGPGNPDSEHLVWPGDMHRFCLPSTRPAVVWEHHALPWVNRPVFVSPCCCDKWNHRKFCGLTQHRFIPLQF